MWLLTADVNSGRLMDVVESSPQISSESVRGLYINSVVESAQHGDV